MVMTMKKTLSLLLAILLCITLFVSCADNEKNPVEPNSNITENNNKENNVQKKPVEVETETETESHDLLELRDEISDNDAMFGIAYLGYNEGTFSDVKNYFDEMSLYELYPFVEDMELDRYCVTGGDDHYLIVPANKEVPIKAYIGVLNYETYSVDKGELVFESTDGSPFIVRGNESEIVPNIVIECGNVEYTPILSGEDGRLVENYGIYDFSPYETINKYFGIENNDVADDYEDYSYLQGTWAIISEKKEMYLELFDGGEAHYEVKSDEEDMNLWGYWSVEGLTLYLDLYGEDYGEAEGKAPLYSGEYGIMYDGEFLTLSLFDGFAMTECMAENGYDSFMCYGVG